MSLFGELKRRNVFRVAIAYVVTAWLLLQVADVVLGNIGSPPWVFQVILLIIGLGLPLAIIFAWAFEITPDGVKKEKDVDRSESMTSMTGRKLDFVIIAMLVVAVGYFAIDRFHVDDAGVAASTSAAMSVSTGPASIAVLPFVNMSSDPEQEYFSDGISEEILNVLAQYEDLRVAARTSSFQFKGQNQDISKIAELLNVGHVLEGSVRKSGDRLRITAQLIKADDGFHLWSETFDRKLDDVFLIQDEIANAISEALSVHLAFGENASRPAVVATANTQAYDAFLRGRELIHQRGRSNLEQAVQELERSLRLDAEYGPAHANLAIAYALLLDSPATYGDLTLAETQLQAVPHSELALQLSPDNASTHAALALLALHRHEYRASIEHAQKTIELNPSYGNAYTWMGIAYERLGEFAEGNRIFEQVLEVDPMSVIGRINLGNRLVSSYELQAAHDNAEMLMDVSPWAAYRGHARAAYGAGDVALSIRWALLAHRENPSDALSNMDLVGALLDLDLDDEAQRISDRFLHWIYQKAGNHDASIAFTQRRLELDPDNLEALDEAAQAMYIARRFDEALELYERQYAHTQANSSSLNPATMLAFAHTRRSTGDSIGAQAIAEIAEERISNAVANGVEDMYRYIGEGTLLAYLGQDDDAIDKFEFAAEERGMIALWPFEDPILDNINGHPRMLELLQQLAERRAAQRDLAVDMMCNDNPVPDAWQPLPATCGNAASTD